MGSVLHALPAAIGCQQCGRLWRENQELRVRVAELERRLLAIIAQTQEPPGPEVSIKGGIPPL
jgi:hypothetical protein